MGWWRMREAPRSSIPPRMMVGDPNALEEDGRPCPCDPWDGAPRNAPRGPNADAVIQARRAIERS
eukprot:2789609-Pyramimonas_sp.AAC.1